jgi:diguanylate cyclase (GGDEF)-like protein
MVELMVSSIFDSGYYASIRVIDLATGKPLVERHTEVQSDGVPQWFVQLSGIAPATAEALVSRGWQQAARVEVTSHPMFAIARLWQSTLGTFLWLLLCGLVSGVVGALVLRRQLRPLDYMVEQSHAIARREFLSLSSLPSTPELRRVVQAMNQMVEKLKALFEEEARRSERLRREAYLDSLTGLANRRYFDMQLQSRLSGEEEISQGYLALLRVCDLAGLNQRLGGQRTDQLLKALADLLAAQSANRPDALLARCRGGEFAVLLPGLVREEAERFATQLENALASLARTGATDVEPVARIGLAPFATGDSAQELMALADEALTQAVGRTDACWACVGHHGVALAVEQGQVWRELIDNALHQERLQLFFQPVVSTRAPAHVLHYKVLSRLPDADGTLLAAGRFLPWVERFGWTARLDLVMLRLALRQMTGHGERLAVSLSSTTLGNSDAMEQVFGLLRGNEPLGPRLTLELEETGLPDQASLETLTRRLRALGFSLSLQHFGGRFSMIGNLSRLGLAWLKIDGSHIREIDRETDKRLFIEAIQRAANSIDLPVIAERVETQGELQVLLEMGIEGAQGRLLGEPGPWAPR